MSNPPQFLLDIKTNLLKGTNQRRAGQTILAEYGYQRRRQSFVDTVNGHLDELGILADPPISTKMELWTPQIRFSLAKEKVAVEASSIPDNESCTGLDGESTPSIPPPTEFRLADLSAAENFPECIGPDQLAEEAFTVMQLNDYSQLVVVDGHQKFKGVISWRSILEAEAKADPSETPSPLRVRECLDTRGAKPSEPETRLEDAIQTLHQFSCLVIVGPDGRVKGIVTPFDLANEFATIVAPFKRIEEIETRLKMRIEQCLSDEDLDDFLAQGGGQPAARKSAVELTFGEVVRLMQNPECWTKLNLSKRYDRKKLGEQLNWVRGIRNDLMHFREVTSDTSRLDNVCHVIRNLCSVGEC